MTGTVIYINNMVVSYSSKKQNVVSRSSFEAEFIALASCVEKLIFMKKLLEFLGCTVVKPVKVYCDNQATIQAFKATDTTKRGRYIDV